MTDIDLEYVGHSCLLITAGKDRIITDPWFTNPVMANSWYHVPRFSRDLDTLPEVNYIYISHEHADHLDIPALRKLPGSATIVIPGFDDNKLKRTLVRANLPQSITALADGEEFTTANGTTLAIYFCDTGSNDSSLIVSNDGTCVYDHTDNWMSPKKMGEIGRRWNVDIAFQCYAGTGSFPAYMLWPLDYRVELGKAKKIQLFERMKATLMALRPEMIVPFGASFGYLRPETLWLNKVCATDPDECGEWLRDQGVDIAVAAMDHGDVWSKEAGIQHGAARFSTTITDEMIAEYSAYYGDVIEAKRAEESVKRRFLELNDQMLGDYLKAWVSAEGRKFVGDPLTIQFGISGATGIFWSVDFGSTDGIVSKALPAMPNLFLDFTNVELFNALVHRHYSLTDLYLSSRIQMNRYPYDTYRKEFFDSFFWWDDSAQIEANRNKADEIGDFWQPGGAL